MERQQAAAGGSRLARRMRPRAFPSLSITVAIILVALLAVAAPLGSSGGQGQAAFRPR